MEKFLRYGFFGPGLIVALHGFSLLFLPDGLLKIGRWSMIGLGFKELFGEGLTQLIRAGIWFGMGLALMYFSTSRTDAQADSSSEPPHNKQDLS